MFALPEAGQDEQRINAHFLEQSGRGLWCRPNKFDAQHAESFFAALDQLRGGEERLVYNGTPDAVAAIEECLACYQGITVPDQSTKLPDEASSKASIC